METNFAPQDRSKISLQPVNLDQAGPIRIPLIDPSETGKVPEGLDQVFPLTLRDCELLAARHSPISRILEEEAGATGPCQPCSNVDPCLQDSMNAIVLANSAYQKNLVAEKALLAYFGLVEVYLQNKLSDDTIAEIDDLIEILAKLQRDGLLREVDPQRLVRQRIDAVTARQDILFNFEKLNENLRGLLGLAENAHPIWTDCQIESWETPPELQAELELGFARRTDLQAIEQLATLNGDAVINTLRRSIRAASPLAGLVLERRLFNGFFADNSFEIQKLRRQLWILHAAQMDLARSTITEHFYAIHRDHEKIVLLREKLESLRKSESRLEAQRQTGSIDVEDVLAVKAEILACRSEIIHAAIRMQMSWIRMKAAQGLLGQGPVEQSFPLDVPSPTTQRGDSSSVQPAGFNSPQSRVPAPIRSQELRNHPGDHWSRSIPSRFSKLAPLR